MNNRKPDPLWILVWAARLLLGAVLAVLAGVLLGWWVTTWH